MENVSIKDMIFQQMDHFLSKSSSINGEISLNSVVEIGSWISAYAIRQRHIQQGQISEQEMHMVLGAVGDFCFENFNGNFNQEDFNNLKSTTLNLLKTPSFDQDSRMYFAKYYQ